MMAIVLVAVGWLYVTVMMALAEATSPQGSMLGAVVTLVLYGLLPLGIVLYILMTPWRRQQRERAAMELGTNTPDEGSHSSC